MGLNVEARILFKNLSVDIQFEAINASLGSVLFKNLSVDIQCGRVEFRSEDNPNLKTYQLIFNSILFEVAKSPYHNLKTYQLIFNII